MLYKQETVENIAWAINHIQSYMKDILDYEPGCNKPTSETARGTLDWLKYLKRKIPKKRMCCFPWICNESEMAQLEKKCNQIIKDKSK